MFGVLGGREVFERPGQAGISILTEYRPKIITLELFSVNFPEYNFDFLKRKTFSVFPWALFRSTKSAIKLHTLLDLRGNIAAFIHISNGKLHDVNVLNTLLPEPGAFYAMDRGYLDFARLFDLNTKGAFFVIRAKSNKKYRRRYSHPTDKSRGIQYTSHSYHFIFW